MATPNKPAPAPLTQEELHAATKILVSEGITSEDRGNIIVERAYRLRAQAELKVVQEYGDSISEKLRIRELEINRDWKALRADLATHKAALRNPEFMKSLLMTALSGMPSGGGSGPRIHKRQISKMLIEAGRWLTEAQA